MKNLESIYNDNAQTGIYIYLDKGMKLSIKDRLLQTRVSSQAIMAATISTLAA